MKVLFLTPSFYPKIGGVEKHVLEISKELLKQGHEITVVTEFWPGFAEASLGKADYQNNKKNIYQSSTKSDKGSNKSKQPVKSIQTKHFSFQGIKIHYLNFGKNDLFKKLRIWVSLFENIEIIKDADVVHCHDVYFWYFPFRFLFPFKKNFVTFHGYESFPVRYGAIIIRKISEILANGNICVGDFIKKWYFTKPDYVIYGGANESPEKSQTIPKNTSALFFGRLDEQTGILEYAKAAELIRRRLPKFKLDVVGSGKYAKNVKKYLISGFIPNPEAKISRYRLVFVSRYLSFLEAMLAKRMVFALYDNKIKEDYLKMSPFSKFISISGSAEELSREVERYLRDPKLEKSKVESGYLWAKAQTWKKMASIYKKLWGI